MLFYRETKNICDVIFILQGDGDSAPDTPPNEESDAPEKIPPKNVAGPKMTSQLPAPNNPFAVEVKVDMMAVGLFLISFATRMIYLDQPKNVV